MREIVNHLGLWKINLFFIEKIISYSIGMLREHFSKNDMIFALIDSTINIYSSINRDMWYMGYIVWIIFTPIQKLREMRIR